MLITLSDEQVAKDVTRVLVETDRLTGESVLSRSFKRALNEHVSALNQLVSASIEELIADPVFRAQLKSATGEAIISAACAKVKSAVNNLPRAAVLSVRRARDTCGTGEGSARVAGLRDDVLLPRFCRTGHGTLCRRA